MVKMVELALNKEMLGRHVVIELALERKGAKQPCKKANKGI